MTPFWIVRCDESQNLLEIPRGVKREERHLEYVSQKVVPMLDKAIWEFLLNIAQGFPCNFGYFFFFFFFCDLTICKFCKAFNS